MSARRRTEITVDKPVQREDANNTAAGISMGSSFLSIFLLSFTAMALWLLMRRLLPLNIYVSFPGILGVLWAATGYLVWSYSLLEATILGIPTAAVVLLDVIHGVRKNREKR